MVEPEVGLMRADAQRNRKRVLKAAREAFATEGLAVPVAEIARRAGVGTGTVSRHFPTKESLYEAVVLHLASEIAETGRRLAATREPGTAFFEFFDHLVEEAAANRGLGQALGGTDYAVEAAVSRTENDLTAVEDALLAAAQQAGTVRADLTRTDVKALLAGCVIREHHSPDPKARRRMIDMVCAGMRAPR